MELRLNYYQNWSTVSDPFKLHYHEQFFNPEYTAPHCIIITLLCTMNFKARSPIATFMY